MAGFYPDAPAPRMAYDLDGTVVTWVEDSTTTVLGVLDAAQTRALNDDDLADTFNAFSSTGVRTRSLVFIFPELRDLAAYWTYAALTNVSWNDIETSVDTTNGLDGTWVSAGAVVPGALSLASMRTGIQTEVVAGIKAVKFKAVSGVNAAAWAIYALHLYGTIAAGENPDRLRLWHPTLDEEVGPAYFDWGDAAQNQPSTKDFRVKNNSATLTATTITVTADVVSEASPTIDDKYTFDDGGGYAATATIASLAPGAISGVITVQRTRPSNAALGLWWARITADAASMA